MTKEKLRLICAELDGHSVQQGAKRYDDWDFPNYPEDLNAVILLTKKQRFQGWHCVATTGLDGTWECFFTRRVELSTMPGRYDFYGAGDTLALALCEALARLHGKWEDTE